MTSVIETLKEDLQKREPINIFVPEITMEDGVHLRERVRFLYRQLLRSKRLLNRTLMVFYAFQIGYLLEILAETPLERAMCQREMTSYYSKVAVRIYYLFEPLGKEQIFRTRSISLTIIARMGSEDYLNLVQEALTEAGRRTILTEQDLLEGEDCYPEI